MMTMSDCYFPRNLAQMCRFPSFHPYFRRSSSIPSTSRCLPFASIRTSRGAANDISFTWDDVIRVSQERRDDDLDLTSFSEKIRLCNRGAEFAREFIEFCVDGQLVGYIHHRVVDRLKDFKDIFNFPDGKCASISLSDALTTLEERTKAVEGVVKFLAGEKGGKLVTGIRNEWYPVGTSFSSKPSFYLERAAAPYFGIKAYGVHMNGFIEREGDKQLWIGKRSATKPTYPGMLDHLVAGGLPSGVPCQENLIKECEEEAGIPKSLALQATPVGAVSYQTIKGYQFKRDVLFCYDLKLPEDFEPKIVDGEVESFMLMPVDDVANVIRRTNYFKENCNLVIIDFLFRHGYISPECHGYLKVLSCLRSGDCS